MELSPEPLTTETFAPFGDIIEAEAVEARVINDGSCKRFDDLANIDVEAEGGRPLVSIFRAEVRTFPHPIEMMERHLLGSQAFVPLDRQAFLVVVASGDQVSPDRLRAFHVSGHQGINIAPGTWHYPLLAPTGGDFLVIDRGGQGKDCDIIQFGDGGPLLFLSATKNG